MTDMTVFERRVADGMLHRAGPIRPVDDLAVYEAVVTTSPQKGWRFTMFSTLKFVAAAAIVALFGSFLLSGIYATQQGDEVLPAAVTESPSPASLEAAIFEGTMLYGQIYLVGTTPDIEEGRLARRGEGWQSQWEDVSDPRLAGTARFIGSQDTYVMGGDVWTNAIRIDNTEGWWLGHVTGYRDPDGGSRLHQGILAGAGAYEGLTAIVHMEDNGPQIRTLDVHGLIFPGEMPEAPDYPEPAD